MLSTRTATFASRRQNTPSTTCARRPTVCASSASDGQPSKTSSLIAATTLACALANASPAVAKNVEITIDASQVVQESCGRAGGVPGSGTYKANCIRLKFTAYNKSNEVVYNADVFGQVKDQANDDVLSSGRIGSIKELQPGANETKVELTVGASQPLPLKLKNMKARGTTEINSMSGNPYDYEDVLAY
mmetsp:Transcript_2733/g.9139  ORF Transcript_2733/g.9139 Transcript_2733/m.9139 type:complete len:189 (+) Transcript_2733:1-567(+)